MSTFLGDLADIQTVGQTLSSQKEMTTISYIYAQGNNEIHSLVGLKSN